MPNLRVAYPGSFDPPTVAHLAIARAAHGHMGGAAVHWIVSRVALGKETATTPSLTDRVAVLREVAAEHDWLDVHLSDARFIADLVDGFDAVVLGADKWRQVNDPAWYGGAAACAEALARLPRVLVVPRGDDRPDDAELLEVAANHLGVSSTAARAGARHLMLGAAQRFDDATGAWTCLLYTSPSPRD